MSRNELEKALKCAAVLALFFLARSVVAQESPVQEGVNKSAVYVGLIEDDRQQLADLGPKDSGPVKGRVITVAFEKDASGWKQANQITTRTKWTIAFDGKALGEVVSEPRPSWQKSKKVSGPSYTESILTPAAEIPNIGKPDGKFNGNFETVVRRPLVVVSEPNFIDPDGWRRGDLPDGVMESIRSSFRHTFQHVRQCDRAGEPMKADWNPPDSEIVLAKAYKSNKRSFLAEIQLKDNRCVFNQDGSHLESLQGNQWFYVNEARQVAHLGNNWELVDAGDYDRDGSSELIFYVAEGSGDFVEREGYILFYDDFSNHVRSTWSDR